MEATSMVREVVPATNAAFAATEKGYSDFLRGHVKDIFDCVPVDGFWFDIVQALDCSCHTCRKEMLATGTDPSSEYLNAYMLASDASTLEENGDTTEALHKLQNAAGILKSIETSNPTWRREVMTYRKRKIDEAITRVAQN